MRSGQNDPERFVDFLSRNREVLYVSSKRTLIIIVVARLGTPFEDTFFVEMFSKGILDGGYEAGMNASRSERRGEEREAENAQAGTDLSRKRERAVQRSWRLSRGNSTR